MQTEIEEQALDWLVRQETGKLAPSEQAQFDRWLDSNTRHCVTFLRVQTAWQRADRLKKLRPLGGAIDENLLEPPVPTYRSWFASAPRLLAVAAAVVVVAFGAWFVLQAAAWETFTTAVGGAERIVLQDGSIVSLNTDSRIRVRLTSAGRRIELKRGEALFQVAHDARRPFVVAASDTLIRAIGTAFAVRLRNTNEVEVLVSEGRVAVTPLKSSPSVDSQTALPLPPTLVAGEVATVRTQGIQVKLVRPEDISRKLAWKEGRLWFDGESLAQVVAEFNRYNRRQLVIADPAIASLRIGGGFAALDPDNFVTALEKSFDIHALPPLKAEAQDEVIRLVGTQGAPRP